MTNERPSHLERLQTAVLSRNMRMAPGIRADADYLAASGVASTRTGVAATLRLRTTSSAAALRSAKEEVLRIASEMGRARRWGLSASVLAEIAEAALVHHFDPACRHCSGRGYRLIPGSPAVSDKQCTHCKCTGRQPIPRKHREQIDAVLLSLRESDAKVEREINALMR